MEWVERVGGEGGWEGRLRGVLTYHIDRSVLVY